MIHKQWPVTVVLDVLAHTAKQATQNVNTADRALRKRLEEDALAPGVNISAITYGDPVTVAQSGTAPQLPQGTKFCVVYLEEDACTFVSHVVGPFSTNQLAMEELASTHPEQLTEDEYGVYRDDDGTAVAQITTVMARPPKGSHPTP